MIVTSGPLKLGNHYYRRIKNLIICLKLFPLWNFGHDWTFKLYCDIQNCGKTSES